MVQCGICFEEGFKEIGELDACCHRFCFECIIRWSSRENKCPFCKERFIVVSRKRLRDTEDGNSDDSGQLKRLKGDIIETRVVEDRAQVWQPEGLLVNLNTLMCEICMLGNDEEHMLLCEGCDRGYHTGCLGMDDVPEGEWFCDQCRRRNGEGRTTQATNGRRGRVGNGPLERNSTGRSRRPHARPRPEATSDAMIRSSSVLGDTQDEAHQENGIVAEDQRSRSSHEAEMETRDGGLDTGGLRRSGRLSQSVSEARGVTISSSHPSIPQRRGLGVRGRNSPAIPRQHGAVVRNEAASPVPGGSVTLTSAPQARTLHDERRLRTPHNHPLTPGPYPLQHRLSRNLGAGAGRGSPAGGARSQSAGQAEVWGSELSGGASTRAGNEVQMEREAMAAEGPNNETLIAAIFQQMPAIRDAFQQPQNGGSNSAILSHGPNHRQHGSARRTQNRGSGFAPSRVIELDAAERAFAHLASVPNREPRRQYIRPTARRAPAIVSALVATSSYNSVPSPDGVRQIMPPDQSTPIHPPPSPVHAPSVATCASQPSAFAEGRLPSENGVPCTSSATINMRSVSAVAHKPIVRPSPEPAHQVISPSPAVIANGNDEVTSPHRPSRLPATAAAVAVVSPTAAVIQAGAPAVSAVGTSVRPIRSTTATVDSPALNAPVTDTYNSVANGRPATRPPVPRQSILPPPVNEASSRPRHQHPGLRAPFPPQRVTSHRQHDRRHNNLINGDFPFPANPVGNGRQPVGSLVAPARALSPICLAPSQRGQWHEAEPSGEEPLESGVVESAGAETPCRAAAVTATVIGPWAQPPSTISSAAAPQASHHSLHRAQSVSSPASALAPSPVLETHDSIVLPPSSPALEAHESTILPNSIQPRSAGAERGSVPTPAGMAESGALEGSHSLVDVSSLRRNYNGKSQEVNGRQDRDRSRKSRSNSHASSSQHNRPQSKQAILHSINQAVKDLIRPINRAHKITDEQFKEAFNLAVEEVNGLLDGLLTMPDQSKIKAIVVRVLYSLGLSHAAEAIRSMRLRSP